MKGLDVEVSPCGNSQKKIDRKKGGKERKRKEEERKKETQSPPSRETGRSSGNSMALLRVFRATYSGERIMAVSCADFPAEMKNPGDTPPIRACARVTKHRVSALASRFFFSLPSSFCRNIIQLKINIATQLPDAALIRVCRRSWRSRVFLDLTIGPRVYPARWSQDREGEFLTEKWSLRIVARVCSAITTRDIERCRVIYKFRSLLKSFFFLSLLSLRVVHSDRNDGLINSRYDECWE